MAISYFFRVLFSTMFYGNKSAKIFHNHCLRDCHSIHYFLVFLQGCFQFYSTDYSKKNKEKHYLEKRNKDKKQLIYQIFTYFVIHSSETNPSRNDLCRNLNLRLHSHYTKKYVRFWKSYKERILNWAIILIIR